ncbi:hypothetical protein SeMB42_g05348 [Synchytrium endobioticum]|uniref:RCC1-like domain-containing protein n=1 Tax=Synchytrium endobioticum TaxID=286115 RepID=A0A507DFP9_9FUNG|nr:hypothetical protein SeMB42_g05348 [Synchytrium endobioticum]TPX50482.1 hypothetical protein SeLEV6574_g00889 [Synchytrium endobioticum]
MGPKRALEMDTEDTYDTRDTKLSPKNALPSKMNGDAVHAVDCASDRAKVENESLQKRKKFGVHNRLPPSIGELFVIGGGPCLQLGLGPELLEAKRPTALEYFKDQLPVFVAAGGSHNAVITADGTVHTWGDNSLGALGRETDAEDDDQAEMNEATPGVVRGLDGSFVTKVVCSESATLALTQEGWLYVWGTLNHRDQGDSLVHQLTPDIKIQKSPLLIDAVTNVVDIAAGINHLLAFTDNGDVLSWGAAGSGRLGRPLDSPPLIPQRIVLNRDRAIDERFVRGCAGLAHSMFIAQSGAVYASGLNSDGQLGIGERSLRDHILPQRVLNVGKVVAAAAGNLYSLLLDDEGQVWSTGQNTSHQLGYATLLKPLETPDGRTPDLKKLRFEPASAPLRVPIPSKVMSLSAGSEFAVAVTEEESDNVRTWGNGESFQLCNWRREDGHDLESVGKDEETPFRPDLKGRRVLMAAAGGTHFLMLLAPKVAAQVLPQETVEVALEVTVEVAVKVSERRSLMMETDHTTPLEVERDETEVNGPDTS